MTTDTGWHLDDSAIDDYVGGRIGDAYAASLEAHVVACASCRAALAARTDVGRGWEGIRRRIERPSVGVVERVLRGCGVPAHIARLLVTGPAARGPWLLAMAISLGFALVASRNLSGGDPLPFLVLAPLVPLAGVAVAFGRPVDPVWELGVTTATGGFRLMLLRAVSVLVTSVVLTGVASLALPGRGWLAAAWLVPGLALTLVALVLSSLPLSPTTACGLVGTVWIVALAIADRTTGSSVVFAMGGQWAFVGLAVAAGVALAFRQSAFERGSR